MDARNLKKGYEADLINLNQQNYPAYEAINHEVAVLIGYTLSAEQIGTMVRLIFSCAITLTPTLLMLLISGMLVSHVRTHGSKQVSVPHEVRTPQGLSLVKNHTQSGMDKSTSKHTSSSTTQKSAPDGYQLDTGTKGKAANRYENIKQAVLDHQLIPSISAIKRHAQCNQTVAERYQNQLEKEGIIQQRANRNGYELAAR